jgi:hypothetical protein
MATQSQVIKQQIEIDGLKETIRHLENTKFNIQAFERIFELGLLETPLEHTVFTRDFYDTDWKKQQVTQHNGIPLLGWGAGSEYYEYIEVMTNQITAKFGVDLKDIKLTYSEDQASIIVSGIQSKYLGNSKLIPNWEMSEIRRVTLDSSKNLKNTQILNSVEAERKRNTFMQQKIKNYQERLSQGLETDFMDEAVINLAQNFIKLFLAPLEKEVKFDNNDNAGLPLLEFIEKEIRDKNLLLEKKNEELPQGAYN